MVTYAIGDIQGCERTLDALLARLALDERCDALWLVGDLVNRGPRSLATLRRARALDGRLGERFHCVLGNHELHLLARAAGLTHGRRADTLDEVLEAPDRDELLDWLRRRPLLHRQDIAGRGAHVLVHAGLHPAWTVAHAAALAAEVEAGLRAPDGGRAALAAIAASSPDTWDEGLSGGARLAAIAAACTRLRTCRADGSWCKGFHGPPADAPAGCLPWFTAPARASRDHTIVFGHWAALGLHLADGVRALDTGCVWGGALTALRLEDGERFSVPCADDVAR